MNQEISIRPSAVSPRSSGSREARDRARVRALRRPVTLEQAVRLLAALRPAVG